LNEAGSAAPTRVTVQSELRYHKDCATRIEKRAIHFSLLIVKDAQVDDFFSHDCGRFGCVRTSNAQQDEESRGDFPGHTCFDHDAGLTHALDHSSHDDLPFKAFLSNSAFAGG
jgi:hypothetical protein